MAKNIAHSLLLFSGQPVELTLHSRVNFDFDLSALSVGPLRVIPPLLEECGRTHYIVNSFSPVHLELARLVNHTLDHP